MYFIAGGTGFTGRRLLAALRLRGRKARCLVRKEEMAVRLGAAGFETSVGDVTMPGSFEGALRGISTVVHLVGLIEEKGGLTFERVHVQGTRALVAEARKAGVKHFFYQSALGASEISSSSYLKSKAQAEEIVRSSGIPFTVFRPSIIVGKGDGFTERMKKVIKAGPVVPVPGTGDAKFQPIYVEDWLKCLLKAIGEGGGGGAKNKTYELGGPEHISYMDILRMIMDSMGVKKKIVHVPVGLVKLGLPFAAVAAWLLRLDLPLPTKEQLDLLGHDNICDPQMVQREFGFGPVRFPEALKLFI